MNKQEIQQEALSRATNPLGSGANYATIVHGFIAKGIPADEITPRVNVFTFHAWKALGRIVKRGEHGVKILTYIKTEKEEKKEGKTKTVYGKRPWATTVFHVSQTEPIEGHKVYLSQLNGANSGHTQIEIDQPEPIHNNYESGFQPIQRRAI